MPLSTIRKVSAALGAGILLLLVVAAGSALSTWRLVASSRWVAHTQEVRSGLLAVLAGISQAEAGVRARILAGDTSALADLHAGIARWEDAFARVRALTADDAAQRPRLDTLGVLLRERRARLQRVAALAADARTPSAELTALTLEGRALTGRIAAAVEVIDGEERVRLDRRVAAESTTARLTGLATAGLVLVALGIALLARRSIERDVAEQQAAERALRASEAKFASILAIAVDAIVTVDADQRILHFNQGAEEIFGWPAAEAIGQPLDILLPERVRAVHRQQVERFGASGASARRMGSRQEIFGLRRSGEEFPAEASISSLQTGGHRLFTVVLRDVTERKRQEAQQQFLAEAGEILVTSLDYESTLDRIAHLAVPVLGDACILDVDGGDGPAGLAVAHVDPGHAELLREMRQRHPPSPDGLHPPAVVRRTGEPLLLPEVDAAFVAAATDDVEHRQMVERLRIRSLLVVPLVVGGQPLGVLSCYSSTRALGDADLTLATELARRAALAIDNARAYRAARQATRARDEVLSIVSHDLRNPISALGMCAQALSHAPEAAEVGRIAETIRGSTRWMEHIIRDLLDVSAIEAGRLAVDPELTSAAAIVETVYHMHEGAAAERGVELAVTLAPRLPPIEADADRIVQAVGNLLGNAIKFTPRGGRVTLAVERRPDGVHFVVTDTGPGIPAEHLPRLFDRFWQARATRRGGAGLGLAIARGIAEAHGGRVEVASTPGQGSTFTLLLPTLLAREAGAPPSLLGRAAGDVR